MTHFLSEFTSQIAATSLLDSITVLVVSVIVLSDAGGDAAIFYFLILFISIYNSILHHFMLLHLDN